MTTVSEEHDRAVHRLDAALSEQDRLSERYEAAVGTSAEMPAAVERQAATAQVAACDAWLKWVDDDGYRGLNAGPFALRSQLEEPPTSPR
jgi:hypothetical protein